MPNPAGPLVDERQRTLSAVRVLGSAHETGTAGGMRSVRWIKALQKAGELRSGLDSAHHEDLANVGRRPFSLSERLPHLVRNRAVRNAEGYSRLPRGETDSLSDLLNRLKLPLLHHINRLES